VTPRLTFATVPERYAGGYIGALCQEGQHDRCPGGFGVKVGFICGGRGQGGPIVSTEEGAPCACTCHDEPEPGE
jgi:hypothetical protein